MPAKFSGDEVVEIAIQIEKKGFEFYSVLANSANHETY